MNSSPSPDPLVSLWQTAPKPDTRHLLRDLERLTRARRLLKRTILAILCGVSLLLMLAEASGLIATRGILSAIWILSLGIGIAWQRRAECNRIDALSLDTISLLKRMIARAKSELVLARWLYAGAPCGALAGAFVTKIIGIGASPAAIAVHPRMHLMLTGAGIAVLLVMVAAGFVLARSRSIQLKTLQEKLTSVEAGL